MRGTELIVDFVKSYGLSAETWLRWPIKYSEIRLADAFGSGCGVIELIGNGVTEAITSDVHDVPRTYAIKRTCCFPWRRPPA